MQIAGMTVAGCVILIIPFDVWNTRQAGFISEPLQIIWQVLFGVVGVCVSVVVDLQLGWLVQISALLVLCFYIYWIYHGCDKHGSEAEEIGEGFGGHSQQLTMTLEKKLYYDLMSSDIFSKIRPVD